MAGLIPNEGKQLVANLLFKSADVDRGTNLDLVLFTNSTAPSTITAATLTFPTGGSYAAKSLVDASWTVSGGIAAYAAQVFTATGSAMTGLIYGYAILTKGTTPRIISIELDAGGPYTLAQNDTYTITPQITIA
jgi:hypothetical protein